MQQLAKKQEAAPNKKAAPGRLSFIRYSSMK